MKSLRIMICAGLALAAMAVCAAMPAAAAVPLENVRVAASMTVDSIVKMPAADLDLRYLAVAPESVAMVTPPHLFRSSAGARVSSLAAVSADVAAYRHVDPHIRG